MAERLPVPAAEQPFNFLAQIAQPAAQPARQPIAQPKQPSKFKNALGAILDGLAVAGGAQPGYSSTRARITQQERQAMVQTARQRLAANPDDQEAFAFLFEESPAEAVAARNALKPQPKLERVGNTLLRVPDGGAAEVVYEGPANMGSRPREVVIAELLADPSTPPAMRAQLERFANMPVYQRDAAGNIVALPKAGAAPTDLENVWARMIGRESGGRQFGADGQPLTSPKGAVGVSQVMPDTAPEAAKLAGLPFDENRYRTDPQYNAALGRAYFDEMVRQFGDPARAAAAYNAGPGRVREAIQKGGANWLSLLPAETRDYVAAVIGGGGASVVVDASAGFRPATQNGLAGQIGPDGRFYPDPDPQPKGGAAAGKQDRRAGDPMKVLQLATEARRILQEEASGGLVQKGIDLLGGVVGASTQSSRAAAKLSQIAAGLVLNLPRLEGPQSDKDVALYKEQAARVGNTELPVADRIAALDVLIELLGKYDLNLPAPGAGGGGGGVRVTAPNGKSYTFPNEQAAAAFRQRAGIR